MTASAELDAIVIGAGPNGLAAAIAIARSGHSVRVYEAADQVGGATRSAALTRDGFIHDVGATICSLVPLSPFLRTLPLHEHGLTLVAPNAPFAHPLDDAPAVIVDQSVRDTAQQFSQHDARAYQSLLDPWIDQAPQLMDALLAPFSLRHPIIMSRFGRHAIRSIAEFAQHGFRDPTMHAMLAGVGAHSTLPLENLATTGYTLALLVSAHVGGWPFAAGGTQQLANAMANYLRALGGEIVTNHRVERLSQLPRARAVLCDVSPSQLAQLSGTNHATGFAARRLSRHRHGPGVFKMDWALHQPVPWRDPHVQRAGTVHLGGTLREIADAERTVWRGTPSDAPYVLLTQPTLFDSSRAPAGSHTLWAYCHVPNGCNDDMTDRIERQIERFAPGFRDCILERRASAPADLERSNANLVGGDIAGGSANLMQMIWRSATRDPYATPLHNVYLCSASTPPGIGVHGMCGFLAAQSALAHSLH